MKRNITLVLLILFCGLDVMGQAAKVNGSPDDQAIVAGHLKDPAFLAAWKLYKQGRGLEAYDAFMVIFRERPGDQVVNFALGLSARLAGKYSQASMAFERILMQQPGNARVRLELALTYYRMNLPEMARMNADRVMESDPPPVVAGNVQDLIKRIKVLQSEWRTVAKVSASVLFDSNPNAGPASRIISIAPIQLGSLILDTLTVSEDTLPQDSFGSSISGSFLGIRDIGEKGGWSAFGSLYVSHSSLQDAHDYDTTILSGVAGLERAGRQGSLQIPCKLESIMLSGDSFATIFGAGANYSKALDSGAHWISGVSLDQQDYNGTSARDSLRISVSQGLRWRLGATASLVSGVAVYSESAENDIYSNLGVEPYVGGFYQLSNRWRIQGRLSHKTATYDEKEPLAPKDRDDTRLSFSMAARYRIRPDMDCGLTYQYTDNNSTFDIYEYDRQLVSINLNWRPL